jgi:hypothetical protein
MNIKSIIASTSLLLIAGAAMADDGLTREQVRNETIAARAAGELDINEATLSNVYPATSTLTRAQVKAETLAAAAAGKLQHNELYDSGTFMIPQNKEANVKAQLAATAAKQNKQ